MPVRTLLVTLALGALASPVAAQYQWPVLREDESLLPMIFERFTLPEIRAPQDPYYPGRPVFHLPLGTTFRFREDRLILPHAQKHVLGPGKLGHHFFHVTPGSDDRTLPSNLVWTLKKTGAVYGHTLYSAYLRQPRHKVYMLLESYGGTLLELEIAPTSMEPTLAQFQEVFDIKIPEGTVIP